MRSIACLMWCLSWASVALAQPAGSLVGRVVDDTGAALSGARVEIVGDGAVVDDAATSADGAYRLGPLPAGRYRVRASFPGLATVEQEAECGETGTVRLDFRLVPAAAVEQDVEVVGQGDVVETETAVVDTSYTEQFIENLPIIGRNYQDVLSLAPGVTDTDGDGAPNVRGSRTRAFQVRFNGLNASNPFTGRGSDFDLNMESIAEVEVITSGASAQYGRGEGFANLITKSGGNEFEGSVKLFYRSDELDGDGAGFEQTVPNFGDFVEDPEFDNYFGFVSSGGPVRKDRLWYFTSVRYDRERTPENVGTDIQVRQQDFFQAHGKLSWQIGASQRLTAEAVYNPLEARDQELPLDITSGVARESLLARDTRQLLYTVRHSALFGPTLSLESAVGVIDFDEDEGPMRAPANPDEPLVFNDRFETYTGPWYLDSSASASRLTWREDLSWYIDDLLGTGQHDLRVGLLYEGESYHEDAAQRPFEEQIFSMFLPFGDRPILIIQTRPRPNEFTLRARGRLWGFYVQDYWKPLPNLSIGIGLRYDVERISAPGIEPFDPLAERLSVDPDFDTETDPISFEDGDLTAFVRHPLDTDPGRIGGNGCGEEIEPEQCPRILQPGQVRLSNSQFSPRFSVSWDPGGSGRTKLFASYGRYYDKIFLEAASQEQIPPEFQDNFQLDSEGEPFLQTDVRPPPSIRRVDRGLRTPFTDEISIGIERELVPELGVRLSYVSRRGRDQLQDVDANHRLLGTDQFGGIVDDEVGVEPPPEDLANDGFPDLAANSFYWNEVLVVGNFNRSRYEAFEVAVTKRLHRNWALDGSYTWSKAEGQADDFESALGNDPATVDDEEGFLDFDQRHVVKVNWVSFLPRDFQLGNTILWESGTPYSIVRRGTSVDDVGNSQLRESFPSGQRNDARNAARWTFDLALRKGFTFGKVAATASLEIENVLNSDDQTIEVVERPPIAGVLGERESATVRQTRRFGRMWQLGIEFKF